MSTRTRIASALVALVAIATPIRVCADEVTTMARVGPGTHKIFDPPPGGATTVRVERFLLDRTAVTNKQFLAFVLAHREWQRGVAPTLFAESSYLSHWASPTTLGDEIEADGPVVRVSWFAAKAYCEARNARLPTEYEWELAADANETLEHPNDPARTARILDWFGKPTVKRLPRVGGGAANMWGVREMHGLVWEWVFDFNTRVLDDGRAAGDAAVCGGTTLRARDKLDYPAFMRAAFRASLRAAYTTGGLGFRCAADDKVKKP